MLTHIGVLGFSARSWHHYLSMYIKLREKSPSQKVGKYEDPKAMGERNGWKVAVQVVEVCYRGYASDPLKNVSLRLESAMIKRIIAECCEIAEWSSIKIFISRDKGWETRLCGEVSMRNGAAKEVFGSCFIFNSVIHSHSSYPIIEIYFQILQKSMSHDIIVSLWTLLLFRCRL